VTARVGIVTTTIHYPEETFRKLASVGDLIVVGDLSTDERTHELVRDVGGVYITPKMQEDWVVSDVIGWRKIQRRNIGFLEAYTGEYDFVISVDDDNCPTDPEAWMAKHVAAMMPAEVSPVLETTESGWFNPGALLSPQVWARGMPYAAQTSVWRTTDERNFAPDLDVQVGVNAGLWLGDPDIDALQRITQNPRTSDIKTDRSTALAPGTWAPINSQNTIWRRDLLPLAAVLPFVGRWDDIFGGYLAQWSFWSAGFVAQFGEPLVYQDRNDHNTWRDLEKEIHGLENTVAWCDMLTAIGATGDPLEDIDAVAGYLRDADVRKQYGLTDGIDWNRVADFLNAWTEDWEGVL
jgi:hypothetical protein